MAALTYSAGTFSEAVANNGTVSTEITITLADDTYAADVVSSGTKIVAANVPAGLTATFVRTSDTVITATLAGTADAHTNAADIANLTFTFQDGAFTTTATAADVTGYAKSDLIVDFADPADTTAPVFSSAAVNGTSLVLTYTDANNLDATNIPATSAFSVTAGGLAVAVSSVAVDAAAKTVTLTLASTVHAAQTVSVTYTDPTGGNDINAIQDVAGNDVITSGSKWVTNNTPTLLSSPDTYVIETTGSPYLWINDNGVSSVVDAAGTQYYGIAAGGKLNLTGSSGANSIYLSEFYRSDLTVSRSGATAVFKAGSEEIASISTPTGSTQYIQFKDGTSLALASDGSSVTLGSQELSTSFAAIADSVAPTLSWSSPADSRTGVGIDGNITLTFSEAVEAGSGDIVISNGSGDTRTIAVTDTSQVTFSGTKVTINPTADLATNTGYYVQIASGAITDLAATPNSYTGITDTTTLNFTTGMITNNAMVFDYSDLAALSNFVANANFAAVPGASPASTAGGSAVVAQGAGTVAATVAHAQFIYNSTDGVLRFDADGTGSSASATVVGTLATGLTLTTSDFVFVA